jgi:diamine N-acetyltransferase
MEPDDLDHLYRWENHTDHWKTGNTLAPFSRHQLERFIESSQDIYALRQLRLMIDEKEDCGIRQAIGCIDLYDFDPGSRRAGVGILIGEPSMRKMGRASESLALLMEYVREHLHMHQLHASIDAENTASMRLFQKLGFEISGCRKEWNLCNGNWSDEYVLQYIFR